MGGLLGGARGEGRFGAAGENRVKLMSFVVSWAFGARVAFASLALSGVGGALAREAFARSDDDGASARRAATAGLKAFQEGSYQEAVDYCTRAETMMHAPAHLLLIARSQVKLGRLVEAQEAYFRLKRDALAPNAAKAFVDAQASAADEQSALAPRIPTLKITLDGAPAREVSLVIDGQTQSSAVLAVPKPVDPGQHTVS